MIDNDFQNVYILTFTKNPSDFELPDDIICIFRSYPWPFMNHFNQKIMDLFRNTFKGKGLIRNCTRHEGNFEMFGERNSKQSTGNLLMLPSNVDLHQYYRESINLNLLPTSRNIVNQLMEQSIHAGYTSGESMMHYYKCRLMIRDAKKICYNSILTQKFFQYHSYR